MFLGTPKKTQEQLAAVDAVRAWTRKRFKLSDEAAIMVSEVECTVENCPPLETVVAFWTEDEKRHQFKLLKPVAEVSYEDIAWLIGSPENHDSSIWECC